MTKCNLAITEHEDKTAQTGKDYTRFKTNNGWMSCFEKDVIAKCKENEGKIVSLEIAESEKNGRTFHNIRGFYEVISTAGEHLEPNETIDKTPIKPQDAFKEPVRKSVKGSAYEKDPVGLAVELMQKMVPSEGETLKDCMNEAIDLVKQAQKAFS